MASVIRRLLNVATLACVAVSLLIVAAMVTGISNWYAFVYGAVLPALGGYLAIAVVNYIAFGRPTLWHKNVPGGRGAR